MQDKLMPVILVQDLEDVRAFYEDVLGFEAGASPPDLEGEFCAFSYGSSNIAVSTVNGLPSMPKSAPGTTLIVIEVADAIGIRNVMAKRHEHVVGQIEQGWYGAFFDVSDPLDNVFRFLQKSDQIAFEGSDGSGPRQGPTPTDAPGISAGAEEAGPVEGDS